MKIKKKSNAVRVPPLKKIIKVKRKSSDVEEESTVTKALENIKKVLEKKISDKTKPVSKSKTIKSKKVNKSKTNVSKPKPRRQNTKGVVYLGHIPHGFYEEQMADYFKQFGRVTRVRVVRSRNTGRSRGYGYVEFLHSEVAKVAAESMNNYLMCGRLLKATYIPPEKQHPGFFAGTPWTKKAYPKLINRSNINKRRNRSIQGQEHKSFKEKTKNRLAALEKVLKEKGYDIKFIPTDDVKV
ncbi:MKI67 FHA domain-interacting nucleolar phosphoprotein-like [Hylaeus anthracinus]|uniref:MKI67 FHA domain-interacting nucleolar phosphoprotein-like n=1 Tax=Hylaeus volcanicus TaxID=313075 RepID=UPI0023B7D861|nr:MKI67 FHA domain-interacting nucleolar phosphoprotein-like [Hylaeus volcanicus]XP_054006949.1 MKI67 FHA domain-interacting nucleolar phosphoprotein-like [Hylaeus anthracinus]